MGRRAKDEGSIFRRKDGTWQGELHIGYDLKGKPIRKTVYGKTKREVCEKLEMLKRQRADGILSNEEQLLSDYLPQWLKDKARNVKPRTVEIYHRQIHEYILPRIGRKCLQKLTPVDVQNMVRNLADTISANAANRCRTLLFSAMKKAVRLQLISRNPVEAVDPLKEEPREMTLWQPEEAVRFLEFAKSDRLYATFYVLMATGLRRGEALGLRWQDIQDGVLTVNQTLSIVNNKAVLSAPKTKRSIRRVAISPDVVRVLEAHRQQQEQERAKLQSLWPETDLMFTTAVGTPTHPRNFERTWYTLLQKSEVTKIRLHDLRHLHVSILVKKGVDPRAIADRMGHMDVGFTLRRYSHMFEEQRHAAAFSIADLFGN